MKAFNIILFIAILALILIAIVIHNEYMFVVGAILFIFFIIINSNNDGTGNIINASNYMKS